MSAMNQTLNLLPPCLDHLDLQGRKESCLFFMRHGMYSVCYSIVSQVDEDSQRGSRVRAVWEGPLLSQFKLLLSLSLARSIL